jgi:hypothetical protein
MLCIPSVSRASGQRQAGPRREMPGPNFFHD